MGYDEDLLWKKGLQNTADKGKFDTNATKIPSRVENRLLWRASEDSSIDRLCVPRSCPADSGRAQAPTMGVRAEGMEQEKAVFFFFFFFPKVDLETGIKVGISWTNGIATISPQPSVTRGFT